MDDLENINKKYSALAETVLIKESKNKKFQKRFRVINIIFLATAIIVAVVLGIVYYHPLRLDLIISYPCFLLLPWIVSVFLIRNGINGNTPSKVEIENKSRTLMKEEIYFTGLKRDSSLVSVEEKEKLITENNLLVAAYVLRE